MGCGILTAVGAAVADAVRVAADHLADGNLAAAPRPIQPLLVQHVLDHHKLQQRHTVRRGGERGGGGGRHTPSLPRRNAARCAKPGVAGSITSIPGMPAC
eukprot:COSAG04_NODE_380_length_15462_cov_2.388401_10_plen_100_part_00